MLRTTPHHENEFNQIPATSTFSKEAGRGRWGQLQNKLQNSKKTKLSTNKIKRSSGQLPSCVTS